MDRLKNTTVLIGRDPNKKGGLLISFHVNGKPVMTTIGAPGSVPRTVSRCSPAENSAHCKIEFDQNGNMTLINCKDSNYTFVNDIEIMAMPIDINSFVSLGKDRYPINITNILVTIKKVIEKVTGKAIDIVINGIKIGAPGVPSQQPVTPISPLRPHASGATGNIHQALPYQGPDNIWHVSIRPLESIWDKYEKLLENIQIKQQKMAKRRMLPIMIGSLSGLTATLIGFLGNGAAKLPLTILSAIIAIISFVVMIINYSQKDTSIEDRRNANNWFVDHYQCPHCHRFLGIQSYRILRHNDKCPFCRSHFDEK